MLFIFDRAPKRPADDAALKMTGEPGELTDEELRDLCMCEDAISRAEEAEYRGKGKMLRAIRDRRLYRREGTWEQYCRARWGYRRQTANGYVRALEVAEDLEAREVSAPATRKQALPLWRLNSDQRVKVARRVDEERAAGGASGRAASRRSRRRSRRGRSRRRSRRGRRSCS